MVRLTTISEEQKEQYLTYFKDVLLTGAGGFKVLEPTENFDDNGLRFPVTYLSKVDKQIIFFPLEYIADYADIITKSAIDEDDAEFIFNNIINRDIDVDKDYDNLNATAIGNLAYVALNTKNKDAQKISEDILDKVYVIAKGKMLNELNEIL